MNYNCGIYIITNLNNGKVYIGSSKNLKTRKRTHCYTLRKNKHANPHLQNAYNLDGEENFQWEILMYCEEKDLLYWEDWFINFFSSRDYKQGYNLCRADRKEWKGHPCSEETKAKLSTINKGKISPNKGKLLTNEQKAKISAKLTGKKQSLETIEKRVAALKGKKRTKEQKARMSDAQKRCGNKVSFKGYKHTEETKMKISIFQNLPEVKEKNSMSKKGNKYAVGNKSRSGMTKGSLL